MRSFAILSLVALAAAQAPTTTVSATSVHTVTHTIFAAHTTLVVTAHASNIAVSSAPASSAPASPATTSTASTSSVHSSSALSSSTLASNSTSYTLAGTAASTGTIPVPTNGTSPNVGTATPSIHSSGPSSAAAATAIPIAGKGVFMGAAFVAAAMFV